MSNIYKRLRNGILDELPTITVDEALKLNKKELAELLVESNCKHKRLRSLYIKKVLTISYLERRFNFVTNELPKEELFEYVNKYIQDNLNRFIKTNIEEIAQGFFKC